MRWKSVLIIACLSIIVILSYNVSAWTKITQEYMANEVCKAIPECNGHYNEIMKTYSMYPDRWYAYPFTYKYHYNTFPLKNCPTGNWACPDYYDQGALKGTALFLNESYQMQGIEKWKYIGMASHYYMESGEFWHIVRQEDYLRCHKKMEQLFDKEFSENKTNFTICTCGVCQDSKGLFTLKNNLVRYIKNNSTPKYFPDSLTMAMRVSRILSDWRAEINHIIFDFNPGVPQVIDGVSMTIENAAMNSATAPKNP